MTEKEFLEKHFRVWWRNTAYGNIRFAELTRFSTRKSEYHEPEWWVRGIRFDNMKTEVVHMSRISVANI